MILARYLRSQTDAPSCEIKTRDGVQVVSRGQFGLHLVLGEIWSEVNTALEQRDRDSIWLGFKKFFETASRHSIDDCETFGDFVEAIVELRELNTLESHIPFLHNRIESRKESQSPPWDYEGRKSLMMVHLLARAYGWSVEQIWELEPEVGFALVNEVLVDEQLEQEWEYRLSDVSREYNPRTRTTRFKPLPRPQWMAFRRPQTFKIPKTLLPQGEVVYLWDDKNHTIN